MKRPPGRAEIFAQMHGWKDKRAGGSPFLSLASGTSALPTVASDSPHLLSHIVWVPVLCPLSPHAGIIPVTSTEAPVMYPLSSDARNATTSATSMGMVGRGHNPSYSHRHKVAIISPKHTPTTSLSEIPQTLRSLHLGTLPRPASLLSAHPQGPPYVPSGSFWSPVRKHSYVAESFFYGFFENLVC